MKSDSSNQWICTRQMAAQLSLHRVTLQRLKSAGYFRQGHHFRKANPLAPQGCLKVCRYRPWPGFQPQVWSADLFPLHGQIPLQRR